MHRHPARGFALLEALIAALLVATAVVGLTQLVTIALAQSSRTRQTAAALTLAQAKLEDLRGLTWQFDSRGNRVSSAELDISPPSTLSQDLDGWVDRLDPFGAPSGPDAAFYWRRWAIAPVDTTDPDTLVLQVCVFTNGQPVGVADACVWAFRTRKP
jgi:type II secretory pathway pseudopilin PulG